jgi:hypothetical protein
MHQFTIGLIRGAMVAAGIAVMYFEGRQHADPGVGFAVAAILILCATVPWRSKDPQVEYQRGVEAAELLIARGDKSEIQRNYGFSRDALDQTQFDAGYQHTIRNWLR